MSYPFLLSAFALSRGCIRPLRGAEATELAQLLLQLHAAHWPPHTAVSLSGAVGSAWRL